MLAQGRLLREGLTSYVSWAPLDSSRVVQSRRPFSQHGVLLLDSSHELKIPFRCERRDKQAISFSISGQLSCLACMWVMLFVRWFAWLLVPYELRGLGERFPGFRLESDVFFPGRPWVRFPLCLLAGKSLAPCSYFRGKRLVSLGLCSILLVV